MDKREHIVEWIRVDRHLAIPISGNDETDGFIREFTTRMNGEDLKDYKLNHLRWETLESLCRDIILQQDIEFETYDFSAPYIVSDITVKGQNSEGKDAFINLWLNVDNDICTWSRDAVFRGISVQTLVHWHLKTNLLTSVSVINGCEFFDSRSQSFKITKYRHIEDGLSDLIIDVFRTLRLPEYTEARDITGCVWGVDKDEELRFDIARPRKNEKEFKEFIKEIEKHLQ